MDGGNFVKVFDVLDAGFRDWTRPAYGLIFMAIGIVLAAFPQIVNAVNAMIQKYKPAFMKPASLSFSPRWFPFVFLGIGALWTVQSFYSTYLAYLSGKSLAEQSQCRVVEGPVQNFVPMPAGGHGQESFSVDGIRFSYSDFRITGGFNTTSYYGGPVKGDSYMRICYHPVGNVILRLEIRDSQR